MKEILAITFLLTLFLSSPSLSTAGDSAKGKGIYAKRCSWCHGKDGAGDGDASPFLNPAPRDFTMGAYKWKSSPIEEPSPSDEDFMRMIGGDKEEPWWDGLNGTSMPGWSDLLSKEDISDVAAYLREMAQLKPPVKEALSMPALKPSRESAARGRGLFKDRCSECHGEDGRGDGRKKLRDDRGDRTWPRDLTKPWAFRDGFSAADVYARVTLGIPGTQMPGFADLKSRKKMTDEERMDVANYVATLYEPDKRPSPEALIKARRADGPLPEVADDPAWEKAAYTNLYLVPQIISGERHFKPTLDSISVKVLYSDGAAAFLLEWDDPTNSVPGDASAAGLAEGEVFQDGAAVEFPRAPVEAARLPYFGMGEPSRPVDIWFWQSPPAGAGDQVRIIEGRGEGSLFTKVVSGGGLTAHGVYERGRRRIVMKGTLDVQDAAFAPVAFAAWDGSNGEKGARHEMTGWVWLSFEPEAGYAVYVWPVVAGLAVFVLEMFWLRSLKRT